jgi:hypothetical protein
MLAATLLASGCVHLTIIGIFGTAWHGPLSFRKPALFGISGGMTIWSLAWLMTHLIPKRFDRFLIDAIAISMFIEVALITMQTWRGVASHFNRSTIVDATIESTMLGLILFVTAGIFYLSWRTCWLRSIDPAMAIAIQGGMCLLTISCLLGIATSVLGELSLSAGRSYEVWGNAGVLKFPHGAALHAIQMLPIVAWLTRRLRLQHSAVRIVQSALAAQVLFLLYAVWQTIQGRDRFDWEAIGGILLASSVLPGMYLTISLARRLVPYRWKPKRNASRRV